MNLNDAHNFINLGRLESALSSFQHLVATDLVVVTDIQMLISMTKKEINRVASGIKVEDSASNIEAPPLDPSHNDIAE